VTKDELIDGVDLALTAMEEVLHDFKEGDSPDHYVYAGTMTAIETARDRVRELRAAYDELTYAKDDTPEED
jgi:hypothetical protein